MGMDRNTVIGFVLLAVLFFGYFYYTRQGQLALEKEKQHIQDSLNRIKPKTDIPLAKLDSAKNDSAAAPVSGFQNDSVPHVEQLSVLENNVIKITFTNKGGQPKTVELKKFKTFDGKPLLLENGSFNKISYAVNIGVNQTAQTADLFFKTQQAAGGGQNALSYIVQDGAGQMIEHQFSLPEDSYMLDFNIVFNGADKLITQNKINLTWQVQAPQVEKDIQHENQQSHIAYVKDGDYNFENLGSGGDKKFDKPVDWITVKQQFFATAIIAKNKFESADIVWKVPDTNAHIIAQATSNFRINIPNGSVANVPLQLFYGPSDYRILKSYGNQMHNIVPLGSGIFAFVKYINRGVIMPVFNFFSSKLTSFGLVIALLTIIIRLLISPLTYQSYVSGAKMKLIKPELDVIKAKHTDQSGKLDQQAYGMEQMKLLNTVGASPLKGCIPALLQIPIFFALYNFFNSNISLRGQSFLWAKDLSSYDSIYDLPFHIPLYGSHISLFTIFAVVTSLLISLYGMANMQDTGNPVMKYMPFIFPVILLGVFNNQPAALTWYYTVSNAITLIIQFVIQKYIINHEKILAQMEANKKKPKVKSKWQERIEAMQANNQKLQEMKQKTNKTKR
jgi:YidC/Oxa1 family membrane protein insertase